MNASNKDGSNKDDAKQNDFISSVTEKLSDVLEDVTDKIGIDNPLTPIDETSRTNSTPPPPSNTPPAPPPAPQPSPMSIFSDNINPVQPPSPPKDTPTEQNMPEQVILKGFKELEQPKKKKKKVIIKTTSKSSKKSVIPEIKETNRSIAKDNSVIDISLIPKTKINTTSLEEIYNEKQFIKSEAFKVEARDTTGAGDNYAAGFLYMYGLDAPLIDCMNAGSLCASETIKSLGARPTSNLKDLLIENNIIKN